MTSEMITTVDFSIISDLEIFVVYHDLFSAENQSKIQPTTGNSAFKWPLARYWCVCFKLWCFFRLQRAPKQRKIIVRKTYLVTKNRQKYNLTQQTTMQVVLLVRLCSLVVPDRRTTVNVEPCFYTPHLLKNNQQEFVL